MPQPKSISCVMPRWGFIASCLLLLLQQQLLQNLQSTEALTFNYFAYGSNVYSPTMTDLREIQCVKCTAAILDGHKLRFNIPGIPAVEPSWACVEASSQDVVHGVMYTLTPQDFARISMSEGVPFGYQWKVVDVVPYQGDGENAGRRALSESAKVSNTVKACTLVTNNPFLKRDIPPSKAYRNIIIQGAKDFRMDQDYIEQLEAVPIGFTFGEGYVAKNVLEAAQERASQRKKSGQRK